MFFETDKVYSVLTCPFCLKKFSDSIKFIPECGKFICGKCYDDLIEDRDNGSSRYNCKACNQTHVLPSNGLADCNHLQPLVKSSPTEKPLSDQAKKLKLLVKEIEDKMEKVELFDNKKVISVYCEQLALEVGGAVESAIKHLIKIEKDLLERIEKYRNDCYEVVKLKTSCIKQDMNAISLEVHDFSKRWSKYFSKADTHETESEIEKALSLANQHKASIQSLYDKLKKEALTSEALVFEAYQKFCKRKDHVGLLTKLTTKIRIDETPSHTLTGHTAMVFQSIFSKDDKIISCSKDKTIKVWNVKSGDMFFELKGHTDWVCSVCLLENGWLASGSGDKTIKIWDLAQRKEVRTLKGHTSDVASLKTLKNGNLVSYSLDNTIKIWNPYLSKTDKNHVLTITGHGNTKWIGSFFAVQENQNLVTLTRDNYEIEKCIIKQWSSKDGKLIKSIPTGLPGATSLTVLSNDQVAVAFLSGSIQIIQLIGEDAQPKKKINAHDSFVLFILQLSNGNLVSCGKDGAVFTIKVWNFADLRLLQTIKTAHQDAIEFLSISSDEKLLASASRDKTIKLGPLIAN